MSSITDIKTVPLDPNGHLFTEPSEVGVVYYDGEPFLNTPITQCWFCDAYPHAKLVGEGSNEVAKVIKPCPHPEGVRTVITLNVPSGRIIVTDDLRPEYDVTNTGFASLNSSLGQAQLTKAMAEIGCAYGHVGNSCPGLYQNGVDSFIIASPAVDEETIPEANLLATITTDLWAYSIADYDDWVSRGGNPKKLGSGKTVVDVPPGMYRFTHFSGERGFDKESADVVIFASIQRLHYKTSK